MSSLLLWHWLCSKLCWICHSTSCANACASDCPASRAEPLYRLTCTVNWVSINQLTWVEFSKLHDKSSNYTGSRNIAMCAVAMLYDCSKLPSTSVSKPIIIALLASEVVWYLHMTITMSTSDLNQNCAFLVLRMFILHNVQANYYRYSISFLKWFDICIWQEGWSWSQLCLDFVEHSQYFFMQ